MGSPRWVSCPRMPRGAAGSGLRPADAAAPAERCETQRGPSRQWGRVRSYKERLAAMKVGVPKEVKNHEYRVAITPAGVHELTRSGHEVFIERDAGAGSSIPDEDFVPPGAAILPTADDVWQTGDLILKVKEPVGRGVPPDAQGPGAVHLPAPRRRRGPAPTRCSTRASPPSPTRPSSCPTVAAAARPHVRGGGPDGSPGRGAPPAARRRRPGRAHGRGIRRLRGQGGGARRRRLRHERGGHRAGHAGRGPAGGQERGPAALRPTPSTRGTARPSRPTPTRSSGPSSTPTWSSAPCWCPARRRPSWSPTSWWPG